MEEKGKLIVKQNVIEVPAVDMPDFGGLGSTYFYKMLEFKDKIAQASIVSADGITGAEQTYGLILEKSIRAAIVMRSKGLKPNDVITICSYNNMDCLIPYYASLFLGVLSANLDPALPLADCVQLLKQVHPKLIFASWEAAELMKDTVREAKLDCDIIIFENTPNHGNFSEFLVPSPEEKDFKPYKVENLKDTATIIFSGGSTGLPKGVCLTHYGMLGSTYQLRLNLPPGIRMLVFPNLYWIGAPAYTVSIILYGANRVIFPKFDVTKVWDLIKINKVNTVSLNPHQVIGMCANGRPEKADTSSLQFVFIVGGAISKDSIIHIRKCLPGTIVFNGYGQTELNGGALGFNLNDLQFSKEKPTSVGKPKSGFSYKIVDRETEKVLGPNQTGELRIKTEYVMNSYYKMDSSEVWDSDGFLKTGDIAYYDEDYCFYIVDRIKDLMKYQMWHISPLQLESILYTHPAVKTCVVTSKSHPVDGDHIMGLVILKDISTGTVTEDEVKKYFDGKVGAHQKLRAGVKFVKSLPETVSNKVDRRKIRELLLKGEL